MVIDLDGCLSGPPEAVVPLIPMNLVGKRTVTTCVDASTPA